jgi:iron(III) transport system permease protein
MMTAPTSTAVLDEPPAAPPPTHRKRFWPQGSSLIMTGIIVVLGGYLISPLILLLVLSFNTAKDIFVDDADWGLGAWRTAFDVPGLGESLWHSLLIWGLVTVIGFPIAIAISLLLARTRIPFSHGLEFLFWVVVIFPALASTYGWIMLGSPNSGFLNVAWVHVFGGDSNGPFNIFSVGGIVWTRLMGDSIAFKVILLVPAFRAMNGAYEEAGRVSGMSGLRTMLRVTLPVMIAPISLVLALQLIKVFQGFEVEYLLGSRFNFYTFSTLIYRMIQLEPVPQYSNAVILATLTAVIIVAIIPVQRWILSRRDYTTVVSSYKPTLVDLGPWKWFAVSGIGLLLFLTTALPALVLIVGSFMTRVGFFNARPAWTGAHWDQVFSAPDFWLAVKTTLVLACTAGVLSPVIFSALAYIMVRTRWRGRVILDSIIWFSAAMPGVLLGLGLLLMFLQTRGLRWLFGSIWSLILVVVFMGITTGVNVFKGVLVQLGNELEEAARVSGYGAVQTYFRIVVPLLMPSTVLVGMLNFVAAAGTTSSIVLLASRDTRTLSILGLQYGSGVAGAGGLEAAGIISLVITVATLAIALPARMLSRRIGIQSNTSPTLGQA